MTRTRTALVALTCLAFALVGTNLSSGPASAADDVVDQSQTASTDCYYTVDDFYSFAQTFTAGRSGPLTRVDLLIDRFAGTPAINVGIYATDDSGIPTGPALATGTLPTLPDSVQGFQSASFSTPPVLVKDTKYAIEASAPGDNTNSGWCFNTNQPYTGGEGFGYATQAPDPAWTPYDVDFAFRTYIGLPAQTITLGDLPALKVGGDDGDLTASASSGLPVTFSSQTPATCTVVGDTHVHPVATGTCTIAADQAGDDTDYASAPQVTKSVEVGASDKLAQTITFENPGAQKYGAAKQLSATASSGLPVTFSVGPHSDAGCVVSSSGYLTFNDVGNDCVIVASQEGNDEYAAADPVTQTFEVDDQDV
ncbi:MAG TPA: hypothetical protein VHZ06_10065, partial [Marmoricola sp.]|nr:hypothetical protein [Marmoricola sp.]